MSTIAPDYRKIAQIAVPFVAALMAFTASRLPSQAQTNHMLVMPASDGYGFDDCLSANKACGHVIADAWCEAHGLSASVSFGRAEDITATISTSTPMKIEPGSFIVNCQD